MSPPPLDNSQRPGLSGLAITGIGCAVIVVIVVVTIGIGIFLGVKKVSGKVHEFMEDPERMAAITNARQNQDIVVLKIDEDKREITFRDKETGEERTLSFIMAAQRKFAAKDENGNWVEDSDPTRLPAWVPLYPSARVRGGGSKKTINGKVSGTYMARTADAPEQVARYYESAWQKLGFETRTDINQTSGNQLKEVIAATQEGGRKARMTTHLGNNETYLVISYDGAK